MFPEELKQAKQWGIYRKVWLEDKQKFNKIPLSALDGQATSSTDSSRWADFETATQAMQLYQADGYAFFFQPPYIGIDLDNIEDDLNRYLEGDIESNLLYVFMNATRTYSEISMSGKGVHIIGKAEIPGARRRKGNVEMYTEGRFFALTGNVFGNHSDAVNEIPEQQMKFLYSRYLEDKSELPRQRMDDDIEGNDLDIDEIIYLASNSKTGDRFQALYGGNWQDLYESQSEADLAFMNMLAFWTARDFHKMDIIFRDSGLMRPKFDEKHGKTTYGVALINKAISENTNYYQGKAEITDYQNIRELLEREADKPKVIKKYKYDDTGNAERFLDKYRDVTKYSYINKCFYFWDARRWIMDNIGAIRSLVDKTVEEMENEPLVIPHGTSDDEKEKLMSAKEKHVRRSRNNVGKESMMKEIRHHVPVVPEQFDADGFKLNVQNGYIDLNDGTLHEHDKSLLMTKISAAEFTDKMECPRWLQFLNEIFDNDQELIRYVQKAIGYSLTASTQEQVMFILYGKGRNGKSVFLEIVAKILGDYAMGIQANSLMARKNSSNGHNEDVARLKGARVVITSEPNENERFDEGLIKQLTGDTRVTASFKGGRVFDYQPTYKIWLATNHKLIVRGTDDGIWRRLPLIPFTVQIPKEKVDKNLIQKLERELPAILNWAVEGCLLWQKEGLEPPESVQKATVEYREEMDTIGVFLDRCCNIGENEQVKAEELYLRYRKWATEFGEHPFSQTLFGRKMSERFKKKRTKQGNVYSGVSLKMSDNWMDATFS